MLTRPYPSASTSGHSTLDPRWRTTLEVQLWVGVRPRSDPLMMAALCSYRLVQAVMARLCFPPEVYLAVHASGAVSLHAVDDKRRAGSSAGPLGCEVLSGAPDVRTVE